jgi:hypothetical protein
MTANSGEALKQARFSGSATGRREAWPELFGQGHEKSFRGNAVGSSVTWCAN